MDPVWLGDTVYFLSDRDGVSNVWSFAPASKQLAQVTRFTDFDVKTLGAGGGALVFEQGGAVHLLDPKAGKPAVVPIRVAGDFPWMMPHWEDVTARMTNLGVSPTGKRVVVESRGEIFTIPADKGDVRNLTASSGSAEREPAWSPDGKFVSYFSDASGEYRLILEAQDGLTPPRDVRAGHAQPLLLAGLVARQHQAALQRHQPQRLGARRRQRQGGHRRPRSMDGAAAHARAVVESRQPLGGVCDPARHALPGDRRRQCRHR